MLLAGFVGSCVVLEWPCSFLTASADDARWAQAGFLSAGALSLGFLTVLPVVRHWRRQRRDALTVCSYCRKVHALGDDWESFETFFSARRLADFSHGVCPECGERVMQDYRRGKEDAGAPAPLTFTA